MEFPKIITLAICLVTVKHDDGFPMSTTNYSITCEITLQLCCLRESCELIWPTITFFPVHWTALQHDATV